MASRQNIPIDVVHLLPVLDEKLIDLLKSLSPEDWQKQTVARLWKVKDVAAHLLDGNIRILSMLRDVYYGEKSSAKNYTELVAWLNELNADWVKAMKRVSPYMLILLHEFTGKLFCDYYTSLDPFDKSPFAVDWAGETESKNWIHIAREYTEKWLHQQQIREAVNKPGLMTRELFYPFIDIYLLGLPHTYRKVATGEGTVIKVIIDSEIGGEWFLEKVEGKWKLNKLSTEKPLTEITIDPEIAWKLFSKSVRPDEIRNKIKISGDQSLGEVALTMVSVMA